MSELELYFAETVDSEPFSSILGESDAFFYMQKSEKFLGTAGKPKENFLKHAELLEKSKRVIYI